MSRPDAIGHARSLLALFAAPLVAGLVCAACARCLPVGETWALALGYHGLVPLWTLLACTLPLARSGKRAAMWCAALGVPALVLLLLGSR